MKEKNYFKRVFLPALILFALIVGVNGAIVLPHLPHPITTVMLINAVGPYLFAAIIYEVFAYLTCWALVLRKGKSNIHVWINYAVWAFISLVGVFY